MNIFSYFQKIGIDTVDESFYRKIKEWTSWYNANVRKFTFYKVYTGRGTYKRCQRKTLGMAKKVCEDIADLLLNEKVVMTLSDADTDTFVKYVLDNNKFSVLGNSYQEKKAYTGTVAYIPYLEDADISEDGSVIAGKIGINYVDGTNIFPVSWKNDVVTECIFTFPHTFRRKKYVHVQSHLIENGEYVIKNTVLENVQGSNDGKELSEKEWKEIKPFSNLVPMMRTGCNEPQFVIDKLNIVNNSDDSNPMGVAIFANSIDVLKKMDIEFDSYSNEFELGRKRIFVSPELLHNSDGTQAFDPDDGVFYSLPEDYDRGKDPMLSDVNMELRAEEHSKAINDDLNYLSMKCGFGTERYRFENGNVKTATEVISENSDMFRTLKKHEIILDDVLKNLIRIIIRLGIVLGNPLSEDCEISIDFDDSIIEDKDAERRRDREEVAMGAMSILEYRMKWYGEDEKTAASNLPEQNTVME